MQSPCRYVSLLPQLSVHRFWLPQCPVPDVLYANSDDEWYIRAAPDIEQQHPLRPFLTDYVLPYTFSILFSANLLFFFFEITEVKVSLQRI